MFAALKLGAATGIGYAFGGQVGRYALHFVAKDASAETVTAATWAGRVAVFLVAATVLQRV